MNEFLQFAAYYFLAILVCAALSFLLFVAVFPFLGPFLIHSSDSNYINFGNVVLPLVVATLPVLVVFNFAMKPVSQGRQTALSLIGYGTMLASTPVFMHLAARSDFSLELVLAFVCVCAAGFVLPLYYISRSTLLDKSEAQGWEEYQ